VFHARDAIGLPAISQSRYPLRVQNLRVLCVSPSANTRNETTCQLLKLGYSCTTHADVDSAVAALRAAAFDIVLTDLWLPSLDGVRVITEAGAQRQRAACILLRAEGEETTDLSFLPSGAVAGGVTLPCSEAELQEMLESSLRLTRRRTTREPARPSCRVLSVLPDRVDTRFLQTLLQMDKLDVDIQHAGTLARGLRAASADEFDVAFVDLVLPDARGVEAIRRLKTLRPELALVVIADEAEACRTTAIELGAYDAIARPRMTSGAVGELVRGALLRKKAEHQTMALAFRDGLTGLHNARYFHRRLADAVAMARREKKPCALFLLDLNGFKAINDLHGHPAGDAALRVVAERLAHSVRGYDVLARLGGDEFAFLIHGLEDRAALSAVAERVVEAIAQPFPHRAGALHLGVSIGVAVSPEDGAEPAALLHAVDQAMYAAKARGGGYEFVGRGATTSPHPISRWAHAHVRHELLVCPETRALARVRLRLHDAAALAEAFAEQGLSALGLMGSERAVTLCLPAEHFPSDADALVSLARALRAKHPNLDLRVECALSSLVRDPASHARHVDALSACDVPLVLTGLGASPLLPRTLVQRPLAGLEISTEILDARGPDAQLLDALICLARSLELRLQAVVPDLCSAEIARALGVEEVLIGTANMEHSVPWLPETPSPVAS
jgi:diguanylate cyclase (GGDEF)-like protein